MTTNDPLYELVRAVTAAAEPALPAANAEAMAEEAAQLAQLRTLFQQQAQALADNTQAVTGSTKQSTAGTGSSAGDVAQTVASSLGAGMFLSPIVSGLLKLFSGSDDEPAVEPLVKFALPEAVNLTASTRGEAVDYGQTGLPRVTNVTVQVNAMDSQGFMDRSAEIAGAVRRAMLESSSLNDVVAEL